MKSVIVWCGVVSAWMVLTACSESVIDEITQYDDTTPTIQERGDDGTTTESGDTRPSDKIAERYLTLINKARAVGRTCGEYGYMPAVPPLRWNHKLYSAALEHSKDMALSNLFSHTGSGSQYDVTAFDLGYGRGSRPSERVSYNGYDWHATGENIAAGTNMDDASKAMAVWIKSPGHCHNIMSNKYSEVGMAVYHHTQSHYNYYWTQDFGTR